MKTNKKNTLDVSQIDFSKDLFPEKTALAKEKLKKSPVPAWILNR